MLQFAPEKKSGVVKTPDGVVIVSMDVLYNSRTPPRLTEIVSVTS